jgi:hypothetical protein
LSIRTRQRLTGFDAVWRTPVVVKLSEREKMKTLLDTLSTVQGFETVALELVGKYSTYIIPGNNDS